MPQSWRARRRVGRWHCQEGMGEGSQWKVWGVVVGNVAGGSRFRILVRVDAKIVTGRGQGRVLGRDPWGPAERARGGWTRARARAMQERWYACRQPRENVGWWRVGQGVRTSMQMGHCPWGCWGGEVAKGVRVAMLEPRGAAGAAPVRTS